jgi:predicted GTPase
MKTPCFAVLGDVNPGKSAVVAALAQDSRAAISPMPGETLIASRSNYRGLFDVWDTPGFQRPMQMLREVQEADAAAAEARASLRAAAAAIAVFGQEPPQDEGVTSTSFALMSPVSGTVLERAAVVGQLLDPATPA